MIRTICLWLACATYLVGCQIPEKDGQKIGRFVYVHSSPVLGEPPIVFYNFKWEDRVGTTTLHGGTLVFVDKGIVIPSPILDDDITSTRNRALSLDVDGQEECREKFHERRTAEGYIGLYKICAKLIHRDARSVLIDQKEYFGPIWIRQRFRVSIFPDHCESVLISAERTYLNKISEPERETKTVSERCQYANNNMPAIFD